MVYLIGSLRNPEIPKIANRLREEGFETFDDWYAAGPEADDRWRDYEKAREHSYSEALAGLAAEHVFEFDRRHLDQCSAAVLVCPAGKSGHLELGYVIGSGRPGYILLDEEPERFDVMYKFATGVFHTLEELLNALKPPTNLVPQVSSSTSRVHVNIPRLGISCACADCIRDRGNLRGSGALIEH